jgi:hypothetical protein
MKILTVAMARNEQDMVLHFVRYYRQFSDVTIWDDQSDDDTAAVARAEGATVLSLSQHEPELEYRLLWVKNDGWKKWRDQYDWMIVVDVDEFLYHEDLVGALRHARELKATILSPSGYQMVSPHPPIADQPLPYAVRRGEISPMYSKNCCFNPKKIHEIGYYVGAHFNAPSGTILMLPYPGLKLLHYHYMSAERVAARYAKRWEWRNNQPPAEPAWNAHRHTLDQIRSIIADLEVRAIEVF